MTHQNDNSETPPAVEPTHYDGPSETEERSIIQGTNRSILILAAVFIVIILIYVLPR